MKEMRIILTFERVVAYFLVLSHLTYTLAQLMIKHNLHFNHAFIPQSIHNTNSTKRSSVCTTYSENQVKLSNMLQNMHTNYLEKHKYIIININQNHQKQCTKTIIIIIISKKEK